MGRVLLHYRSYVVTCNTVLLALSNRFRAGPWTPAQCVHGHATVRSVHVGARDLSRAPFETLPIHQLIEEERLPGYKADRYFPASIGQILRNRYQIVGKVGYGGGSTVWACRDLKKHRFVAIKICTTGERGTKDALQEVAVSDHIKSLDASNHPGTQRFQLVLDHFVIEGLNGNQHRCLIFPPLGQPLTQFRKNFPGNALEPDGLRITLLWITIGLDLLHQAGVVHTDLSPNNVLVSFQPGEERVFEQIEELEMAHPTPRKVLPDRCIYRSYKLGTTHGPAVITDFGASRIGDPESPSKHSGDVMPGVYRAPEIIMGGTWDSKIDMWSLGVMIWDLFEGGPLFHADRSGTLDDEVHLAEMVSLLGPPPKAFLERYEHSQKYWDPEGKWIASTPVPEQSLETRETRLQGEEKLLLLELVRKLLCWLPEDRKSAEGLYDDPFIQGYARE